jgi:hypothetical protein
MKSSAKVKVSIRTGFLGTFPEIRLMSRINTAPDFFPPILFRINYIWTAEGSRLNADTSEAIFALKTHAELSWEALSGELAANPGALKGYILHQNSAPPQQPPLT